MLNPRKDLLANGTFVLVDTSLVHIQATGAPAFFTTYVANRRRLGLPFLGLESLHLHLYPGDGNCDCLFFCLATLMGSFLYLLIADRGTWLSILGVVGLQCGLGLGQHSYNCLLI